MGELNDRVAHNRTLAPLLDFKAGVSLWQQYPRSFPVTRDIVQGVTSKVLLSRAHLPLWTGHHRLDIEGSHPYPGSGVAHHFKWRHGLLEMLKRRVANERREDVPWRSEAQRLLMHLESHNNYIVLD